MSYKICPISSLWVTLYHEGISWLKNVLRLRLLYHIHHHNLCVKVRVNPSLASVYCTCHVCL